MAALSTTRGQIVVGTVATEYRIAKFDGEPLSECAHRRIVIAVPD